MGHFFKWDDPNTTASHDTSSRETDCYLSMGTHPKISLLTSNNGWFLTVLNLCFVILYIKFAGEYFQDTLH